ncbi:MAG TPA: DUF998 domain-containing protein [Lysobacter sp.]|nr:DUF998 domain-containing protein [Lysobacter sp.]
MTARRRPRLDRTALPAWLALASCVAAALVAGAALEGYSHARHPLALLGAPGLPGAAGFAVFGWMVPGLLAAWTAVRLRGRLPSPVRWGARLGCWMLALSALAFALQGLLPLDPRDLDSDASRLHAGAWMLWWVAYVPGAALLAWGLSRLPGGRARAPFLAAAALLVLVLAALPQLLLPAALAQRLALLLWLLSFVVLSGSAASAPGSSPPART